MSRIPGFEEFWIFYLREHGHPWNRRLHFVGTSLGLGLAVAALVAARVDLGLAAAVVGYGCAWTGHFLVERNRPATFRYPLWSLRADLRMWFRMLTGRPLT